MARELCERLRFNPFRAPAPKPYYRDSGHRPLPKDPTIWHSDDWDDMKLRKLAVHLQREALGRDKDQVFSDARRQAYHYDVVAPAHKILRIRAALDLDLESPPHGHPAQPAIGHTGRYSTLHDDLIRLYNLCDRLRVEVVQEKVFYQKTLNLLPRRLATFDAQLAELQLSFGDVERRQVELTDMYGRTCLCRTCYRSRGRIMLIPGLLAKAEDTLGQIRREDAHHAEMRRLEEEAVADANLAMAAAREPRTGSTYSSWRPRNAPDELPSSQADGTQSAIRDLQRQINELTGKGSVTSGDEVELRRRLAGAVDDAAYYGRLRSTASPDTSAWLDGKMRESVETAARLQASLRKAESQAGRQV